MKVLFIHNYYRTSAPSGEDCVAQNELQLLENKEIEVVRYEKFNDRIDDTSLLKKIKLGLEYAWSATTYEEVKCIALKERPDIAHIHSLHPQISPSVYAACQDAGVPVVHTLHNFRYLCPNALLFRNGKPCEECVGKWPFPGLLHRCYRGSLAATSSVAGMIVYNRLRGTFKNQANRYIALTEFAQSRFVAGGLPAGRIEVKPNFQPESTQTGKGSGGYAVFVGRLTEEKGIRTLLSAWGQIEGMHLKIVGDGALRGELEDQVQREHINASFLGFLPRESVLNVVGDAEFQLVTSECYESFGMVVLEAYSCGTPVISSRIGSLDEIVIEGETGLKFEAGNPEDLVQKINILRRDKNMVASMRLKARFLFEEKYTLDKNFNLLMDIYQRAIEDFKLCNQTK